MWPVRRFGGELGAEHRIPIKLPAKTFVMNRGKGASASNSSGASTTTKRHLSQPCSCSRAANRAAECNIVTRASPLSRTSAASVHTPVRPRRRDAVSVVGPAVVAQSRWSNGLREGAGELRGHEHEATSRRQEAHEVVANDPEDLQGKLKRFGGSQSDSWNNLLANQAVSTLCPTNDAETRSRQYSATLAALGGIGPKDEVEGMIAAQLIAAHYTAIRLTFECSMIFTTASIGRCVRGGRRSHR
jgi:hypothetical protein